MAGNSEPTAEEWDAIDLGRPVHSSHTMGGGANNEPTEEEWDAATLPQMPGTPAIQPPVDPNIGQNLRNIGRQFVSGAGKNAAGVGGFMMDLPGHIVRGQALNAQSQMLQHPELSERVQVQAGETYPAPVDLPPAMTGNAQKLEAPLRELGIVTEEGLDSKEGRAANLLGGVASDIVGMNSGLAMAKLGAKGAAKLPRALALAREFTTDSIGALAGDAVASSVGSENPIVDGALRMVGGVGGSLAANAAGGAVMASKHAGDLLPGVNKYQDARKVDKAYGPAAQRLETALTGSTEDLFEKIDVAEGLKEKYPGWQPTLDTVSDNRVVNTLIAQMGKKIRPGKNDGPSFLAKRLEIGESNAAYLTGVIRGTMPNDGTGIESVRKILQDASDKKLAQFDNELGVALDEAARSVPEIGRAQDSSKAISRLMTEDAIPKVEAMSADLYAPLVGMQDGIMVQTTSLKDGLKGELAKLGETTTTRMDGIPKFIQDKIDGPDFMSFAEFRDFRTGLNDEIQMSLNGPTRNNALARILQTLKATTDDALDEAMKQENFLLPGGGNASAVATTYREATDFYHQMMRTVKDKATGSGRILDGKTAPSDAAASWANPNGGKYDERVKEWKTTRNYFRQLGLADEADGLDKGMRDYLLRDAYDYGGFNLEATQAADVIEKASPERMRKWLQKNSEMLKLYPELAVRLKDSSEAKKLFDAAGIKHETSIKEHNRALATTLLGKDFRDSINTVTRAKDPLKAVAELKRFAGGNPDLEDGLRRAVWDQVVDDIFEIDPASVFTPDGIQRQARPDLVLDRLKPEPIRDLLTGLMGKEYYDELVEMASLANRNAAAKMPNTAYAHLDEVENPGMIAAVLHNSKLGAGVVAKAAAGSTALFRQMTNVMNEVEILEEMGRAVMDPPYLKKLLANATEEEVKAHVRRIRATARPAAIYAGSGRHVEDKSEQDDTE